MLQWQLLGNGDVSWQAVCQAFETVPLGTTL